MKILKEDCVVLLLLIKVKVPMCLMMCHSLDAIEIANRNIETKVIPKLRFTAEINIISVGCGCN
jgi:hypothetical protein